MERLQVLAPKFFIRSSNNSGDLSKTYAIVLKTESYKPGLVITNLVLTKNVEEYVAMGFKILKRYKDYHLCSRWYAMKVETYAILTNKLIDSGIISTRKKQGI